MHWFKIIFCFLIGCLSLYYGIKLLKLYLKVKGWSKVKAIVISKAVVPKKLASGSRASKILNINYTYEFDNVPYKNNLAFLVELLKGERGFTSQSGEKFLQKIPDEVEIFVDPKDPTKSLMYCNGLLMYVFMIITGIILLFVALVYALSF